MESLTCENVLYWGALCKFIKEKGDDGDEMLEQVLPDAATYADYLYEYESHCMHTSTCQGKLLKKSVTFLMRCITMTKGTFIFVLNVRVFAKIALS